MTHPIVLLGAHGVGKSTLGRLLSHRLGCPFHEEIGGTFAQNPHLRPKGSWAGLPQGGFDHAVLEAELCRDRAWPTGWPRLVETWHPGNLAYAQARGTVDLERYTAALGGRSRSGLDGAAILLEAPLDVLRRRQHEPGDIAFFLDVAHRAFAWAERLGLTILGPFDTSGDPAEVVGQLQHAVGRCA